MYTHTHSHSHTHTYTLTHTINETNNTSIQLLCNSKTKNISTIQSPTNLSSAHYDDVPVHIMMMYILRSTNTICNIILLEEASGKTT